MALGDATVNLRAGHNRDALFVDHISFAADGAYPTGGTAAFETYVRAAIERGNVDVVAVIADDCGGYVPVYDRTNDKLKVYYSNSDAADGPLIEVPNATDLDAVTFKLTVLSV